MVEIGIALQAASFAWCAADSDGLLCIVWACGKRPENAELVGSTLVFTPDIDQVTGQDSLNAN